MTHDERVNGYRKIFDEMRPRWRDDYPGDHVLPDGPPQEGDPARGDAWEPSGNGRAPPEATRDAKAGYAPPPFPDPLPASALVAADPARYWLCKGLLARGEVTMMTSLWKTGKTTFLAHLFRALAEDGLFCGLDIAAARVLCVTEEPQSRWAKRRDRLQLADHIDFLIRPFPAKPGVGRWLEFIDYLRALVPARGYDLLVLDPVVGLWPVRQENDAGEVQAALMPLHGIADDLSVLAVHHNRKADGAEGIAGRGSGAFLAFVDTIVEFRRYNALDRHDRRRVLTGYGRDDEVPPELVIELTEEGNYVSHGDRRTVRESGLTALVAGLLPEEEPGMSVAAILANWPEPARPGRRQLDEALERGESVGCWRRSGLGKKSDPYLYVRAGDASQDPE